jgi:putative flippase GtrA
MRDENARSGSARAGGFLKFAASSLISFFADYGMYSLFVLLTRGLGQPSVPLSNAAARILSAGLNFWINKRFVFHIQDRALWAGARYALLAVCVLAGNTALLSFLVYCLGISAFAAKPVAETAFFLVSWSVQKAYVFRKQARDRPLNARRAAGGSGETTEERNDRLAYKP